MKLAKEEMAESNKFTHHILNGQAQTHTQKKPRIRGLFFELLNMNLAKEEMAEINKFTHDILNVEAQTHIQKKP